MLNKQASIHYSNVPWAVSGSFMVAVWFVAMLWKLQPHPLLLWWLAAETLVLGFRLLTRWRHAPHRHDASADRRFVRQYRLGFVLHGLAWGMATLLPLPQDNTLHLAVLIVVLSGLAASSYTLTSFDLIACIAFGVPEIGLLAFKLLMLGGEINMMLAITTIGALLYLSQTARRANRIVHQYVSLQVTQAAQAEALRSSEELLARTGATAEVGGWELSQYGRTMRLTSQACLIHDLPLGAQPGLGQFIDRYPAEHRASLAQAFEATIAGQAPLDMVLPLFSQQGDRRWVRLIGQHLASPSGTQVVSGVVQDITQAKNIALALAEKHHLLTLLVETTSEGFWFVDGQGLTTDANPAMCRILGCERQELVGRSIFDFVDAENRRIFEREIAQRARGIAGSYEITLRRADGTAVVCINHATPIFNPQGERMGSVGMWSDITPRKQAELQLRSTTEQLQRKTQALQVTLEAISQGIISTDAQGRTLAYNHRALELLDLPTDLMEQVTSFGDLVRFQIQRGDLRPDGSFEDVNGQTHTVPTDPLQAAPLYVRRTRPGYLVEVRTRHLPGGGMVRTYADVTAYLEAQQALHDSERELRALLDAFPGFIAVTDEQLRYTYVNQRFADLMNLPREAVVGRLVQEVLKPDRAREVHAAWAQVQAGKPVTTEAEYPATAFRGQTFIQVTHAMGSGEGHTRGSRYAFALDITDRKVAEQAMEAAKNEAERANRAKSQFLSSMSHELRTPMNAILGFGQLMMSDPMHPLAPAQQARLGEMLRGAQHLLKLINEVLDLAVVETGKLRVDLGPVALAPLVGECLALLRPLAEERQVRLQPAPGDDCRLLVMADRMRLKQVLLNLLGNAIKYNCLQGSVNLDAQLVDGQVTISVHDDGPGLDADQVGRLFDPFERLDATRSGVEGAGLGLALCKGLVAAMHGQIGVASRPGAGSRFWIRLNQATEDAAAAHALPAGLPPPDMGPGGAVGLEPRTVLYVEDNPVNVMLMEAMLARLSQVRLVVATHPVQGLQMAADLLPDLILMDIQLPGMDGFEVLRRLRQYEACQHIPVIAVSANAMPADVERGLRAGFLYYLTKPLDLEPLHAAVLAALNLPAA